MIASRQPFRRSRLALGMKAVVTAYVLAAVLLPLGHHDVVCHLNSRTHCTTCVVGSSVELTADPTTLIRQPLRDTGRAAAGAVAAADSVVTRPSSGRSPPAAV